MKALSFCFSGLFLCSLLAFGQRPEQTPPGVRQAEKARSGVDEAPPLFGPPKPRPASADQLKREATELAELAGSLPAEIDQASKGQLPKDLDGRLKRIEKLSKKLRRDLAL